MQWTFEVLDGNGNGPFGRVEADVGQYTTVTLYGLVPHVWYFGTNGVPGNGDLRHAWYG